MKHAVPPDNAALRSFLRRHRFAVALSATALVGMTIHANVQMRRADFWQLEYIKQQRDQQKQTALTATHEALTQKALIRDDTTSKQYKTTLIGKDGSRTPLEGKSLHIEQGDGRLLEVLLERQHGNWLLAWAPARRDDKYFNWPIFRPRCANRFSVEMERIENQNASAAHVAYDTPAAVWSRGPLPEPATPAAGRGATLRRPVSGYYTTTLVGEDGSRTLLEGKAIHIEQGGGRLLEISLQQWSDKSLLLTAPWQQGDEYFNWPILRIGAANVFYIEMDRIKADDAAR